VYVLHALWVWPPIWLAAIAVAVWRRRQLPSTARRALVFCVVAVVGGLLVSESEPLLYYNVRYLSYLLPFLMVGAFTVLLLPAGRRQWLGRSALVTLLLLAGVTTWSHAFQNHRALQQAPIAQTFPARFELRKTVGNARVSTTIGSVTSARYLAYVFHRKRGDIHVVKSGARIPSGYVFAISNRPPGRVVWQASTLALIKVPAAGTRAEAHAGG